MSTSIAQERARSAGNFEPKEMPPWSGLLQAKQLIEGVSSYNAHMLDGSDLAQLSQAVTLIREHITSDILFAAAPPTFGVEA